MKTCYKPWMKELKRYRFSRDGLMTTETARDQRQQNATDSYCVWLSRQLRSCPSDRLRDELVKRECKKLGFIFPYAKGKAA